MENQKKQTNLLTKCQSTSDEKIKKFGLNHVTIVIEEIEPSLFSAFALEINSPLNYQGNAKQVAAMFSKWMKNTLTNMSANGIKKFNLYAQL